MSSKLEDVAKDLSKLRYYVLHFAQGSKIDWKIFPFNGGLQDAILEGRRHCEKMYYRFCLVKPAIVDLKHQEELKFSDPEWNESMDEGRVKLMEKVDSK